MKKYAALAVLIALTLLYVQPAFSESNDDIKALRKEIETLKEGQKSIQKDLKEIKGLLQAKPAAQPAAPKDFVLSDSEHLKGDKNAKVVLVEYSDYQWPFCARYVRETLPQIESEYIKTGKIKYVFRDLPLESIHKNAFKAAEAASCAGDQGKFWEMHDMLFSKQTALGPTELPTYAKDVGLDVPKFQQCLDSGKFAQAIRKNMAEASSSGINGTPAFVIGVMDPKGSKVKALKLLSGAQPFAAFKDAIDNALSGQK